MKKKTCIYLIIVICALSFAFPIFLTITNSFMSEDEVVMHYGKVLAQNDNWTTKSGYMSEKAELQLLPDYWSLRQYVTALFLSPDYLMKFWNSVVLVIPTVLLQLFVAILAAYALTRYRSKTGERIFFVYTMLMLLPFQVTLVPNFLIAKALNIYNTYWAIILPGMFSTFSVYMLTKYMRRIPMDIIEAACMDGANEWKLFTRICLPLCRRAIISTGILVFIEYWSMVEQPLVLLEDVNKHPLSIFLSEINVGEVGIAFAVAVIYMMPTVFISLCGEEYLIDGIAVYGRKK